MSCNPQFEDTVPAVSMDSLVLTFSDSPKNQKHKQEPSSPIFFVQNLNNVQRKIIKVGKVLELFKEPSMFNLILREKSFRTDFTN